MSWQLLISFQKHFSYFDCLLRYSVSQNNIIWWFGFDRSLSRQAFASEGNLIKILEQFLNVNKTFFPQFAFSPFGDKHFQPPRFSFAYGSSTATQRLQLKSWYQIHSSIKITWWCWWAVFTVQVLVNMKKWCISFKSKNGAETSAFFKVWIICRKFKKRFPFSNKSHRWIVRK